MNSEKIIYDERNFVWYFAAGLLLLSAILAFFSPGFSLALIFALTLIVISMKRTEIGIYFLAVYIVCEPFLLKFTSDEMYPFLKYSTEAIIFILFFITLWKYLYREGFKYIKTPADIPLAVFILITAVSALINLENPLYWLLGIRQIFRYGLLYYTIIYGKFSKKIIKNLVWLIFAILLIESSIGMAQAIIGRTADEFLLPGEKREFASIVSPDYVYKFWSSGQRVFATMGRYDRLGIFICMSVILSAGLFYEKKEKKKMMIVMILFPIPALILTYSRMSWLGLIIALLFMNIIIRWDKKFIIATAILIFVFAGYLLFYSQANELDLYRISDKPRMAFAERFLALFSISELNDSYNGYGRLYFAVNTPLKVVKKYPFFGAGLGQYGSGVAYALNNREKYDEAGLPFGIEGTQGQIDSNWFSLWGETGTFGVMAFLAIIISFFIWAYKLYKKSDDSFTKGLALGFLGIILSVSFHALLGPYFEARTVSFYFWLIAGMV
ncbi:MAG: O-antigen ligase family protein, partial [bacterium]